MTTITINRTVPGDPERVWCAWTEAEEMAQWWWPQLGDTTYRIDAVAGGTFEINSAQAGFGVQGTYLAVERPRLLRFTWFWGSPDEAEQTTPDVVEVRLEALPDGQTAVVVEHRSDEDLVGGGAQQGWEDCLDRLAPSLG